jgi:hypothetical protein
MKRFATWFLLPVLTALAACTPGGWQDASPAAEAPALYPDYTDIVIPCNIAPLNFNVLNPADACVAVLSGPDGKLVLRGPEIRIPEKAWRRLTASARGSALQGTVYVRRDGKWLRLPDFRMEVSADDIDPYVTYRLIEPGYSSYGNLVLRQRDLTSFRERDLYNNQLISGRVEQQCINCHSFQNYGTDNFQFHARRPFPVDRGWRLRLVPCLAPIRRYLYYRPGDRGNPADGRNQFRQGGKFQGLEFEFPVDRFHFPPG